MSNDFLVNFWFYVLALVWVIYIFQEAFISGGSFLMYFIKDDSQYKELNRTIGTHWDGIQVWLILAIGGLFASFPASFSQLLNAMYIPVFLLMYVIIIRGLSIELIYKTENMKMRSFMKKMLLGSSVGMILIVGIYLQTQFVGTPVNDTFFSFLAIFKIQNLIGGLALVGFMMINGYLFLGFNHGFEVLKPVEKFVKYSAIFTSFCFIIIVQILGNVVGSLTILSGSIGIALIVFSLLQTLLVWKNKNIAAFFIGMVVILCYVFMGFTSIYPNAIVYTDGTTLTMWDAAAETNTLTVMFKALCTFLPIVIGYQAFKFIRFWKKIEN